MLSSRFPILDIAGDNYSRLFSQFNHCFIDDSSEDLDYLLPESYTSVDYTLLLYLAMNNNALNCVRFLLSRGADPNYHLDPEVTILHSAFRNCSVDIASELWRASTDQVNSEGCGVLAYALMGGKEESVRFLLNQGLELNSLPLSYSPLRMVINENVSISFIFYLLSKGAPVNGFDEIFTPFDIACFNNRPDIAFLLAQYGANLGTFLGDHLHEAIIRGNTMTAIFALSIGISSIDSVNSQGNSAWRELFSANDNVLLILLPFFLQYGADPNQIFSSVLTSATTTPLHEAVKRKSSFVAETLLDRGSLVNLQDSSGNTPLHLAAMNDDFKIIDLLLRRGGNRYIRNYVGNRADLGLYYLFLAAAV